MGLTQRKSMQYFQIILAAIVLLSVLICFIGSKVIGTIPIQYRNESYYALYIFGNQMIEFALQSGIELEMGEHERSSCFLERIDLGYREHMGRGELFVLSCDVALGHKQVYIGMKGGRMEYQKTRTDLVYLTQERIIEGVKNNKGDPYDGGSLFLIKYKGNT